MTGIDQRFTDEGDDDDIQDLPWPIQAEQLSIKPQTKETKTHKLPITAAEFEIRNEPTT